MKGSFTEGMIMLEDLKSQKNVKDMNDSIQTSYAELLCSGEHYFAYILTAFPSAYLSIRIGSYEFMNENALPKEYSDAFSKDGTLQHTWQALFNEYRQNILYLTDANKEFKDFNRKEFINLFVNCDMSN